MTETARDWFLVDDATERDGWHPLVRTVHDYWLRIAPPGLLPGRQHMDPLDIPDLLPRIWLLDVIWPGPEFRFRLVGSRIVNRLGHDPTGERLEDASLDYEQNPSLTERYRATVEHRQPTYRLGPQRLTRTRDFEFVENIFLPMAEDGRTVDMLMALSVLVDNPD
ncbi:PAS domain-containing protein [Oceanibaculum indicum]|uniref:PAS domain-containing protein n=1 Tax=Oceanibaculum indicum TaxID=526216 RepID=UPI00031717BC|nr:PAS domain-containing protein [Oceanibaculum indicum]